MVVGMDQLKWGHCPCDCGGKDAVRGMLAGLQQWEAASFLGYPTAAHFVRAHEAEPVSAGAVSEVTVDVSWSRRQNLMPAPGLS